jgi:AraC-like DNA-binding protein
MITINGENGTTGIAYVSSGLFIGKDWAHPKRIIDSYELLYVIKGEVFLEYADNPLVLPESSLIVIYPGVYHGGYKVSESDTSFYWLHFRISDEATLRQLPQVLYVGNDLKLRTLFNQLLDVTNSENYPNYTADLITATIICEVTMQHRSSLAKERHKITNEICEWVRINSDKKLTVEMVSEQFGYNPDYLSRLFKAFCNKGLKQYIYDEKIKAAKNLLISSYKSIKQISDLLGWENENQFIKFFKYHESVSPKKYRELYVSTHLNKK